MFINHTSFSLFPLSISLLLLSFILSACGTSIEKAESSITEESLRHHIRIISDDSYMGRAPATKGEEMVVDYLINEYQKMGIQPGMPDGSYIQEVPVLAQTTRRDATMTISRGNRVIQNIPFGSDMVMSPYTDFDAIDIKNAELVYVGYGIQAPEEDWDDYKGLDVNGKILVFKNSDPSSYPDKFAGTARLYYGRWSYKFEIAQELGALGAIIIHTTPTAGYPWSVVQNSFGRERFELLTKGGNGKTQVQGWISAQSSRQLFEHAGLDLAKLMDDAEKQDFRPVSLGNVRMNLNAGVDRRELTLKNVVGFIPGNDPDLKNEYVVLTAHHDHLGVAPAPIQGDSIYNGALDNASGTSAMLNMANAYSKIQPQLKRSILFLAVGGEESGLLGSAHYAANPTVHPGRITANINIDGINIFGRTRDIVSVGYGKNTIDDIIKEEAARTDRIVKPDAFPEQGFFYRSDHFSFAKIGVPAIYTNRGTEFIGKPENYGVEVAEDYNRNRYHTVFDEYEESWDMEGAVEDIRLLFRVGLRLANDPEGPVWFQGNEFEAARLRALEALE